MIFQSQLSAIRIAKPQRGQKRHFMRFRRARLSFGSFVVPDLHIQGTAENAPSAFPIGTKAVLICQRRPWFSTMPEVSYFFLPGALPCQTLLLICPSKPDRYPQRTEFVWPKSCLPALIRMFLMSTLRGSWKFAAGSLKLSKGRSSSSPLRPLSHRYAAIFVREADCISPAGPSRA